MRAPALRWRKRMGMLALALLAILALTLTLSGRRTVRPIEPEPKVSAIDRFIRTAPIFAMNEATAVAGHVFDPNRRPVATAHVCASVIDYQPRSFATAPCSQTDAHGHYELRGLSKGTYSIGATAPGYLAGTAADGRSIALRIGETRRDVDIVLQSGDYNLIGTVVDATGGPVSHAVVRGERTLEPTAIAEVETDDQGHFAMSFAAGLVVLSAGADGYAPAHRVVLAPNFDARLTLIPGASLRGHVVLAQTGRPVENAEVRAVLVDRPLSPLIRAGQSDGAGSFEINGLEPGSYVLRAIGAGLRGDYTDPIELGLGDHVEGLLVEMQARAQVSGRVVQLDGRPCERGLVTLGGPDVMQPAPPEPQAATVTLASPLAYVTANIGPDGVVLFPAVVAAHYYVTVQCVHEVLRDGPRTLDVHADDLTGVTWKVGAGSSLTVFTVDERDRPAPGVDFTIQLPHWDSNPINMLTSVRSDASGVYRLAGVLAPGGYEIARAGAPDAEPVHVEVADGAQVEAKLKLTGSAAIDLTVSLRGGNPVDGLRVIAVPIAGVQAVEATLEAATAAAGLGAGRYRASGLKPARYEVTIDDGINPTIHSGPYDLSVGTELTTQLQLERGASIRGRVVDENAAPLADVWVSATTENPESAAGLDAFRFAFGPRSTPRVLTDVQGGFVLDRLELGSTYTLRAEQSGGAAGLRRGAEANANSDEATIVLRSVDTIAGPITAAPADAPSTPRTTGAL
jgi:hypothetical protein